MRLDNSSLVCVSSPWPEGGPDCLKASVLSEEQQRTNSSLGVEAVIPMQVERKTPRPRGVLWTGEWKPD